MMNFGFWPCLKNLTNLLGMMYENLVDKPKDHSVI